VRLPCGFECLPCPEPSIAGTGEFGDRREPSAPPLMVLAMVAVVAEGGSIFEKFNKAKTGAIEDPVRFTKWTTSCLNLLDKLSISTNRFVKEFGSGRGPIDPKGTPSQTSAQHSAY
jgi:hypothetical protein